MSLRTALDRLTATEVDPAKPPAVEKAAVVPVAKEAANASPKAAVARSPAATVSGGTPKTGPGAMMKFLNSQTEQDDRLRVLQERLQAFEGALPVRRLDASRVRVSRFANRHEDHYKSLAYTQLVDDISAAGRNVQPIRVRPVTGDSAADFEVVYGHRRLRACQQLSIPVEAILADDDDVALFESMCRENAARADLSPFEEGMSYRRALELGIYPSQRKLAAAVGVTQAHVSQVLVVANLPDEVLAAFPSPLEIQYRWAETLERSLKVDRTAMIERARGVVPSKFMSAKQVFEYLTEKPRDSSVDVVVEGKKRAVIRSRMGVVSVAFSKHAVPAERISELQDLLAGFLDRG